MMVAINAAGHNQLSGLAAPIALFNLVNFTIARFYRNFSLTQVCENVPVREVW